MTTRTGTMARETATAKFRSSWPGRQWSRLGSALENVLGLVTILIGLAVVTAIPLLQFVGLGYLLDASSRVARSGRVRDGFVALKPAARIGKILVALWLLFLPIRLLHSFWKDAGVIDPGGEAAGILRYVFIAGLSAVVFFAGCALWRGGRWRHFLWPAPITLMRRMGGGDSDPSAPWREWRGALLLWDWLKLGFLGFVGGTLWLLPPVLLMFAAGHVSLQGVSFLLSLTGGILLGWVALHLPFIQTRYAVTRRFRDFLDLRGTREAFRRAPLAFWVALAFILLFALPLYLLKIELAPREIAWIPNLVFVVSMFPARILVGWAMSRAFHRERVNHWIHRWMARFGLLPVAAIYVFFVWLAQYLSWNGGRSLFEQHAFLLPG